MSSSDLGRWSGVAALVGGGLWVVGDIAESLLLWNQAYTEAAATGTWIVVQVGYLVASVLILLGLVGLYLRQAREAGSLGMIAFGVTFLGGMLAAGSIWSEAFFGAWLADVAPDLLEADPSGALGAGVLVSYLLFLLGWFLFGLASLQAGVLSRGAAVLVMIGAVVLLALGMLELPFAGIVYGVAVAWMGYELWTGAAGQRELIAEAAR